MEYTGLLPSGGHTVHLGSSMSTYTVSMFHQLRCLDLIRQSFNSHGQNQSTALSEHCLNYMRQRFLCRPNLRLESVRDASGTKSLTNRPYDIACPDWTAVYDAAEENYERYRSLVSLTFILSSRLLKELSRFRRWSDACLDTNHCIEGVSSFGSREQHYIIGHTVCRFIITIHL